MEITDARYVAVTLIGDGKLHQSYFIPLSIMPRN